MIWQILWIYNKKKYKDNLDKKILLVEWPNFLEKIIKDPIIFKINFGKTNYERDVIINIPKKFTMIEN